LANIVNLQYEKEIIAIAQEPVARTPKKTEGYRVVAPWLMGRPNRYHKLGSDQVLRVAYVGKSYHVTSAVVLGRNRSLSVAQVLRRSAIWAWHRKYKSS